LCEIQRLLKLVGHGHECHAWNYTIPRSGFS
jgi:hypothetical protein